MLLARLRFPFFRSFLNLSVSHFPGQSAVLHLPCTIHSPLLYVETFSRIDRDTSARQDLLLHTVTSVIWVKYWTHWFSYGRRWFTKKEERKLITSFFSHKFLSLGKRWYSSPFFFPFLRIKQRRRGKMNISGWQPRVWERQIYSAGWKEAPMAFHAFSVTFKSQLFRFCSEAQLIRCWKPVHGRIIDRQSPFIALGEQKVSTVAHDQCIAPLCLLVHLNGSLLMRISGQSEELLA